MNCPTLSGNSCSRCCPGLRWGDHGWTTGQSSTGSCGSSGPGWRGGTCLSDTGRGPASIPVSAGGQRTGLLTGCSVPRRRGRMPRETLSGWCRSTPPSSAPASTRSEPEKGAPQPDARPVPRRTDQQDPLGVRRSWPPAGLRPDGREQQRLHAVHRRDGGDTGAPARSGQAPRAAQLCHRRQGLQLEGDPHLAAAPRHRPHHSRTGRPYRQPGPAGSLGGCPPAFDKQVYKRRNVVERCFNRLKQWRGIAARYDKSAQSYQAAVTLASLLMWA